MEISPDKSLMDRQTTTWQIRSIYLTIHNVSPNINISTMERTFITKKIIVYDNY